MARHELGDTLIGLIQSVESPVDSGLVITELEMDVPLEVSSGSRNGELIFFGSPPHTRWKSGVLPSVHLSRFRVELIHDESST